MPNCVLWSWVEWKHPVSNSVMRENPFLDMFLSHGGIPEVIPMFTTFPLGKGAHCPFLPESLHDYWVPSASAFGQWGLGTETRSLVGRGAHGGRKWELWRMEGAPAGVLGEGVLEAPSQRPWDLPP